MRLLRIGFIAAVAMAFGGQALAADLNADQRAQGKKEAPAAVQAASLQCTVNDAYFMGNSTSKVNGKDVQTKIYEVACGEGLGYVIISSPTPADTKYYDCLSMKKTADAQAAGGAKGGGTRCVLPANLKPEAGLGPIVTKVTGTPCTISGGIYLGTSTTDKISLYEARCTDNRGFIIMNPLTGATKPLTASGCDEAALYGVKCTLTTDAEVSTQIEGYAKASNPSTCQMTNARWVITTTDHKRYYEVACADNKSGYIFNVDSTGKSSPVIPCGQAENLAGGCTLTNVDVAKTQEAGVYTQQAKQIGYPCTVTKYQTLGAETAATHREVVELACQEHQGSVWSFLPTGSGGDATVVNCLRAQAFGLPSCKLAPVTATYADLSLVLKGKGKSCTVSNARYLNGVRSQTGLDFVEAACSEGGGYIISYLPKPIETAGDVFTCKEAAGTNRACTLSK